MPEGVARGSPCSPVYYRNQSLAKICLKIAQRSSFNKVEFIVILPIYAQIVKKKGAPKSDVRASLWLQSTSGQLDKYIFDAVNKHPQSKPELGPQSISLQLSPF